MLRRANRLVERARERIRLAAENDPHTWPERDDDRAILVHDDVPDDDLTEDDTDDDIARHGSAANGATNGATAPGAFPDDAGDGASAPGDPAGGDTRPPLGSPRAGAPDLDVRGGV